MLIVLGMCEARFPTFEHVKNFVSRLYYVHNAYGI